LLLSFPSSDEPRQLLPIKVSRSLEQALEKLNLSSKAEAPEGSCAGSDKLMHGSGVARGKFNVGFCMADSAQGGGCCMLSHLQTHGAVSRRRVAMGCAQGPLVLSWGAGGGAAGTVWGQVRAACAPG